MSKPLKTAGPLNLPHLESVYIPDSVEAIEIANLYNCPHLKEVRLPEQFEFRASYSERHRFFKGCNLPPDHFTGKYDLIKDGLIISDDVLFGCINKHITKLVIPSGIKTISDSAFKDFRELESVTIPEGVEQIFDEAFMNCSSLSNINLPQSLIRMGDYVFKNCNFSFDFKFTLNNVECGLLPRKTELMFKDGLAIANNAVIYYTSGALKNVVIPEGIERIESLAFFENENIESVKIPSSVKSIGRYAFGNCSLLSCVDIPDSLEDIEDNAFICCALPQNFHQIVGGVVFQNGLCIKDKQLRYFTNSHLEKFEIPGRVEFIQNLFLTGKENIKSITLPRTPVQIDDQGCLFPRGLKELNIPSFLKREYDKSTFKSINFNKVVKFI